MEPTYSQDARVCRLSTPTAPQTLNLVEFSGVEHVNDISVYHVRALAPRLVDCSKLLGQPMEIEIKLPKSANRIIHLLCFSGRHLSSDNDGHLYEFELRPWIWMMNFRTNSRIFKQMSVRDILTKIFTDYGQSGDSEFASSVPVALDSRQEYVVQYQESDLNFCRRLLEENGASFHFDMLEGRHKLVVSGSSGGFKPEEPVDVGFVPTNSAMVSGSVPLSLWQPIQQVTSNSFRTVDYNYQYSSSELEATRTSPDKLPELQVFEYPGRFQSEGEAREKAFNRLDERIANRRLVNAAATSIFFGAGVTIEMKAHEGDDSQKGKYVVLSATSRFASNGYRSGAQGDMEFHSTYALTSSENPIVPQRATPRPRIVGPQTAKVAKGAETGDEYGRVSVRFHWDENQTSILSRVAQMWAGDKWGTVFVPRVGMEVVVEFLDADPERPLITGCVYNDKNRPPWDGLGEKEISGIKSQTVDGDGYNEISLNDTAGAEDIIIHAQKDMHVTIEDSETVEIKKDAKRSVHKTETITVDGKFTMESLDSIELKVGASSIKIDMTGVTIKAPQIEITASAALKTKGLIAEYKADGTAIIQAPIVKIN